MDPDDLKREIDRTLAELEALEDEVMDFFAELGPDAVRRVVLYKEAQAHNVALNRASGETEPMQGNSTIPQKRGTG